MNGIGQGQMRTLSQDAHLVPRCTCLTWCRLVP